MDALETGLVIVICINLMLVLGQFSAMKVNPTFTGSVVDCPNSPLGQFGNCTGSKYDIDTSNANLPLSKTTVDATTGNVLTDAWNTVKSWLSDTFGLKYVKAVVGAPTSFLKGMGLDPDFSNLLGGAWWIITVILFVAWLKR